MLLSLSRRQEPELRSSKKYVSDTEPVAEAGTYQLADEGRELGPWEQQDQEAAGSKDPPPACSLLLCLRGLGAADGADVRPAESQPSGG